MYASMFCQGKKILVSILIRSSLILLRSSSGDSFKFRERFTPRYLYEFVVICGMTSLTILTFFFPLSGSGRYPHFDALKSIPIHPTVLLAISIIFCSDV